MPVLVSAATTFLPGPVGRGKTTPSGGHEQGMTVHKSQAAPGCSSGPPIDVRAWRRCRLLEAGFPPVVAELVATDPRFDLHALLELVDRGCPPELAVRIVAPIPPAVAP